MTLALRPKRFPLILILAIAVVGMVAGVLSAQEPTVYTVLVGSSGPANTDLTAYFPSYLQVHQGDMVVYTFAGFHNARFSPELAPLVVVTEVDGAPLPQINPAVAFPTSMEPGPVVFDGSADVGSGLPDPALGLAPFVVTINAEPGVYSVWCDVHPGMVQAVEVVAADVAVPSPDEVGAQAGMEINALVGVGLQGYFEAFAAPQETTDTGVEVYLGQPGGSRAEVQQFFPAVTAITAGQTVTFEVPEDHAGGHVVGWPPLYNQDVVPMPQEGGPPILAVGPSISQSGPASGETLNAGVDFNSGLLEPGQSYTLTFADAGVYRVVCSIHPGMQGVVIVNP